MASHWWQMFCLSLKFTSDFAIQSSDAFIRWIHVWTTYQLSKLVTLTNQGLKQQVCDFCTLSYESGDNARETTQKLEKSYLISNLLHYDSSSGYKLLSSSEQLKLYSSQLHICCLHIIIATKISLCYPTTFLIMHTSQRCT